MCNVQKPNIYVVLSHSLKKIFFKEIEERRQREKKRETLLFHLFVHSWLLLVSILTGDRTSNLGDN